MNIRTSPSSTLRSMLLPIEAAMDLFEQLSVLMTTLRDAKADYALCGGFALAVYGIVRATEDLDILVPVSSLPTLRLILSEAGFKRENPVMEFAAGRVQISRFLKLAAGEEDFVILDVLHVTAELEPVWRTRMEVNTGLGLIHVVSRQGLIALKELRGSPVDISDIAQLKREV